MAKRVSIRHMRKEAPEWIFPWRPRGDSYFPKLLALVFVAVLFTLLITSVRIRVATPTPWASKKAAVIFTTDDADSRLLTLRAREGGPFPSRFEPAEWDAVREVEQAAFDAVRWTASTYRPALRPLPEKQPALPLLFDPSEPVLPTRRAPAIGQTALPMQQLVPQIEPLSGLGRASLPRDLPAFDGVIDAALTSESWRFLLRLGRSGEVLDCVSLTGGDEKQAKLLASWLRKVSFKEDAQAARWVSVAVSFANQPLTPADGTLDR